MPESSVQTSILQWYADHARDLPWRRPDATPWAVLVSEVMLQQTQVSRVLPVYDAWMTRWPTPASLVAERAGEAVRMWGRLGYPRRAVRLHQAATAMAERHDGTVPSSYDDLTALPGIGDYTASAVLAFAFRERALVLDTNVRRVVARVAGGAALPPPALTRPERMLAESLLPEDPGLAARWSVAAMEFGALLCTSRAPGCTRCPVADLCTWRAAGFPGAGAPRGRGPGYAGTDRQCRGRLLGLLREAVEPVSILDIESVWDDVAQRERALASLLDDGLVVSVGEGSLSLP